MNSQLLLRAHNGRLLDRNGLVIQLPAQQRLGSTTIDFTQGEQNRIEVRAYVDGNKQYQLELADGQEYLLGTKMATKVTTNRNIHQRQIAAALALYGTSPQIITYMLSDSSLDLAKCPPAECRHSGGNRRGELITGAQHVLLYVPKEDHKHFFAQLIMLFVWPTFNIMALRNDLRKIMLQSQLPSERKYVQELKGFVPELPPQLGANPKPVPAAQPPKPALQFRAPEPPASYVVAAPNLDTAIEWAQKHHTARPSFVYPDRIYVDGHTFFVDGHRPQLPWTFDQLRRMHGYRFLKHFWSAPQNDYTRARRDEVFARRFLRNFFKLEETEEGTTVVPKLSSRGEQCIDPTRAYRILTGRFPGISF